MVSFFSSGFDVLFALPLFVVFPRRRPFRRRADDDDDVPIRGG